MYCLQSNWKDALLELLIFFNQLVMSSIISPYGGSFFLKKTVTKMELKDLIFKAVTENITIQGKLDRDYDAQELLNEDLTSDSTLEALYGLVRTRSSAMGKKAGLRRNYTSPKQKLYEFQLELLQAIWDFRQEKAKEEKLRKELLEQDKTIKELKANIAQELLSEKLKEEVLKELKGKNIDDLKAHIVK